MTDATRHLRLLCNGLPGRARWRPRSQRVPHKCHTCGARPVQLVWRSPSPPEVGDGEDGMAWCADCIQPGTAANSWAYIPLRMIPSSLREQAHLLNQEQNRNNFDTRLSHFGPCPLCGLGEAGSEHIWQWCSAASMAWSKCGDGSSRRDALAGRCNDRLRLTIVASQVVFLYTSLIGRTSANADDSARRIAKAVRAIVSPDGIQIEDDEGSGGECTHADSNTWATCSECARCKRGEQDMCRVTRRRHRASNTQCMDDSARVGAAVSARISVDVRRIVATVCADSTPARWMVASSSRWPQPHTTQEEHANCEWLSRRCRHCGRHEACLFARQPIQAGEGLTVPPSLAPRTSAALVPYEVFFDGGTCNRDGNSAAGAGALLWHIHSSGAPTCIARAILATPGDSSASLAESHACGLALRLLTSLARHHWGTHGSALRARLVGDCIPVIRYASAQARFRSANQRAPIDHGVGSVSEVGWNLEWQAVNRRHNSHAHALARIAAGWANDLCLRGSRAHRSLIEWRGLGHSCDCDMALPTWP